MDQEHTAFDEVLAAAKVGSWKIEVDEGEAPRMYGDATMRRLLGVPDDLKLSPEELYRAWYDHVDIAHYGAVQQGVDLMIKGEQAEIQYPWHHPDGRTILVRCGGVRDLNYVAGARIVGIHQWVTTMVHIDRDLEAKQRKLDELVERERERYQRSVKSKVVRKVNVQLAQPRSETANGCKDDNFQVLVVDDVSMNRLLVKALLGKLGVDKVVMADSGFSALEKLRGKEKFNLVLSDIWMPGMNGEQLVQEIRKNPEWQQLPVFAVTADVEVGKDYCEMGFTGMLLKPVTLEKIKQCFGILAEPKSEVGKVEAPVKA